MSQSEPKAPYIYQPYGMQDKEQWFLGRIYGVAGVSNITRIDGLTKAEAEAVLKIIKGEVALIGDAA